MNIPVPWVAELPKNDCAAFSQLVSWSYIYLEQQSSFLGQDIFFAMLNC